MFRLLIIFALVSLAELHLPCSRHGSPWRHRPHHEYHRRHENRFLDDLTRDIIDIDRRLQQLCTRNGNARSREIFGIGHYKLTIPLAYYKEEDITVTAKYRILLVNAQNFGEYYEEIRIIPDLVDTSSAHWKLENNELSITFPYISPINIEAQRTCEIIINDNVLSIPKSDDSEEINIDIRLASDNTTTVPVHLQGDAKPVNDVSNDLNDTTSQTTIQQLSDNSTMDLQTP